MTAQQMINKLQRITEQELQQKMEILITSDPILKQEKIQELKRGDRPNGSEIGTYRSNSYSLFKSSLNPLAGGYVDLILTGAFSNNLFIEKRSKRYFFDSTDSKSDDLFNKYGQDLRGLSTITFERAQKERYAPELVKLIKQKIGQ